MILGNNNVGENCSVYLVKPDHDQNGLLIYSKHLISNQGTIDIILISTTQQKSPNIRQLQNVN